MNIAAVFAATLQSLTPPVNANGADTLLTRCVLSLAMPITAELELRAPIYRLPGESFPGRILEPGLCPAGGRI